MFSDRPIEELASQYIIEVKQTNKVNLGLYEAMTMRIGLPRTVQLLERMIEAYDLLTPE